VSLEVEDRGLKIEIKHHISSCLREASSVLHEEQLQVESAEVKKRQMLSIRHFNQERRTDPCSGTKNRFFFGERRIDFLFFRPLTTNLRPRPLLLKSLKTLYRYRFFDTENRALQQTCTDKYRSVDCFCKCR